MLCWDVTVISSLAEPYINEAAHEAGSAAEVAASHKEEKHADLDSHSLLKPIRVETLSSQFPRQQLAAGHWHQYFS